MKMYDKIVIDDAAKKRMTGDGYLVANPRVARTGIQLYAGDEVGRKDMRVVRVYRPEDEVFKADAFSSLAHRPITNDHPPAQVDSKNWKTYSVGHAGDEVARDGDFIRVPMVVMDAKTIDDVETGKAELSVGYSCDLKWGAGVTPSGEAYDAIQTNIRANHIAIVDRARGGDKLRIGDDADQNTGEDKMADTKMKNVLVDGITVEMSDTAESVVARMTKNFNDTIADLQTKLGKVTTDAAAQAAKDAKTIEDLQKAQATDTAKIATLEQQVKDGAVTPAKLDQMVKDRAIAGARAKAVHADVVIDGKTEQEIKSQVVTAKLGDKAKDWNEAQVTAAFDTLTADVKVDVTKVATGSSAVSTDDGLGALRAAFSHRNDDAGSKSQNGYDKRVTDAWKGPAGQA